MAMAVTLDITRTALMLSFFQDYGFFHVGHKGGIIELLSTYRGVKQSYYTARKVYLNARRILTI